MTKSAEETLSISINHGVNADSSLFRLRRGTNLRIIPGPSLLGRHVALYCNYPITGEKATNQMQYTKVTKIITHYTQIQRTLSANNTSI